MLVEVDKHNEEIKEMYAGYIEELNEFSNEELDALESYTWEMEKDIEAWLVQENGETAGFLLAEEIKSGTFIDQFYIKPSHRKQNIGTKNVQAFIKDRETVILTVYKLNIIAQRFWEKQFENWFAEDYETDYEDIELYVFIRGRKNGLYSL